jgi:multiple sugar transport system permease protein
MTVLDVESSPLEDDRARPLSSPAPRNLRIRVWLGRGGLSAVFFAIPMLVVFAIYSWWPIVQTVIMSFEKTNLITSHWVGIDNFVSVLSDPLLARAVINTLYFAGLALVFGFPLPILMAMLMSEVRRLKGLYSVLAYLPVVIPPVVAVLLWKFFYDASPTGVFNTLLGWVGIGPQTWIQSEATVMPSLVLEATWAAAGGSIIIYLAALLSVSPELYDAAEVDGAGIWSKIWHVTLPQLRGVIFIMLVLQLIATAQVFLEPFLFTGGGPSNSSMTVLLLIYHYAFQDSLGGAFGKATALSLMLAIVLAIFSWLYFRITQRWSTN